MGNRLITYPVQVQQVADEQQRIVDSNNAIKVFNYEEQIRQSLDFTSKGLPVPSTISTTPPTLTRFDAAKYMALFMDDDERAAADASEGKPAEREYDNLGESYSFYTYVPSAAPVPAEPLQPKNPLGVLIDDELGYFSRAIGDKKPIGSTFNFLGTDYVLTNIRTHNLTGSKLIPYWVRQDPPAVAA